MWNMGLDRTEKKTKSQRMNKTKRDKHDRVFFLNLGCTWHEKENDHGCLVRIILNLEWNQRGWGHSLGW